MRHVYATIHVLVAVDGDDTGSDEALACDVASALLSEDGPAYGLVDWGYATPDGSWRPIALSDAWMEGEFLGVAGLPTPKED